MREQLTESDVKKIEEEIQHRKHVIRKEAIEAVKEARAQGDLSENFEYHAAKKYKNQNESRIRYLERMLKNAEIVSDTSEEGVAGINNRVTVYFRRMTRKKPISWLLRFVGIQFIIISVPNLRSERQSSGIKQERL